MHSAQSNILCFAKRQYISAMEQNVTTEVGEGTKAVTDSAEDDRSW